MPPVVWKTPVKSEHSRSGWPADFKKKGGYQQSVALAKTFDLYRQDYCGCVFSKREREAALAQKAREAQGCGNDEGRNV